MTPIQASMTIFLALAVTAASAARTRAAEPDPSLRAQLERVAQRRIFFGHQSVGMNVLEGVKMLAQSEQVSVRIEQVATASDVGPGTIGHEFLPENGRPLEKLQNFAKALTTGPGAGVDIALMKFCFVDFTPDTDAKALFERYRATIRTLQERNPHTVFVHVTVPLTTVQGGLKALVKRLIGRAPYGILENMRREEYNHLLRTTYQGREPIFDLARVESTAPDEKPVTVEWKGHAIPTLDPAYTNDGAHLDDTGKLRAARALVFVLAAIPERPAH